jgi:hypothetical protein
MHRSLLLPAAAFAATLSLGCSDRQSPTSPADDLPAPAFGASVERSTTPLGFAFDDGRHILFLGVTYEALVSIFCTGTPFVVDEVNQLLVTRPDGSTKLQFKGEVNVVVVDLVAFDQSFCQNPAAVPTYTGTARLVLNDGDLDLSGHGADAAQMHLVGTVTGQTGQRYHLVAINHSVIGAEFTSPDDYTIRHAVQDIKLTPIGR